MTTPNSRTLTPFSEDVARVLRRDVPDAVLAPMTWASLTDSRSVREAFRLVAYGFAPFLAEASSPWTAAATTSQRRVMVEEHHLPALFFERVVEDLLA